jgi:hypothetical protein
VLSAWSRKHTIKFAMQTAHTPTTQGSSHVEITNENKCSSVCSISRVMFTLNSFNKGIQLTRLIKRKYRSGYMKLYVEKCPNFDPMIRFATVTMLQLTKRPLSSTFWPNNRLLIWNTHLFPWFGSEFLVISRNKICPKGAKILGHWSHTKKYDDGTESYSL